MVGTAASPAALPFQTQRLQNSPNIIKSLPFDILASVPQHLGKCFDAREPGLVKGDPPSLWDPHDSMWEDFLSMDVSPWMNLRPLQDSCDLSVQSHTAREKKVVSEVRQSDSSTMR